LCAEVRGAVCACACAEPTGYSKGIDKFTLIHTRNVITKLLENAMHRPVAQPSRKTPPVPDLHYVQLADIPIIEAKEYQTRMQRTDVVARRRTLRGTQPPWAG
jgi:hypothetical protein